MSELKLEICALNLPSALAAQEGGAQRIELCENLGESGTTPSYGMIKIVRELLKIDVYVLIRPRAGDCVYDEHEVNIMREDIRTCGELGCDGVVIGALLPDGSIDLKSCAGMIEMAERYGMGVTFHRAFDIVPDQSVALEQIIQLRCERILTSGGKKSALEGASTIASLVQQAAGRIKLMAGGGVTADNAIQIMQTAGVHELHASAKARNGSVMRYVNEDIRQGNASHALYSYESSQVDRVRGLIAAMQG